MSILSAFKLCLECAICCKDTSNVCIYNYVFLVGFGESLTFVLGKRVL